MPYLNEANFLQHNILPPVPDHITKQTIGQYFQKSSPSNIFNKPKEVPPYKVIDFSYIGIEIEIENIEFPVDDLQHWQRKEDGSLRNNGWEYISFPIKGDDIAYAITELKTTLEKMNNPIFSGRTSVHIHMNVRDMTIDQLRSLILLYQCFERALYNFVSPNRYKNIFCTPISQTGYRNILNNLLYGDFFYHLRYWSKYTGFNLLPIRTFGTVEFRHMKGNLEPENIFTWINIIQKLKIAAMNTTFEQLTKDIIELNTNSQYDLITFQTFGEDARYIQNENLHKQIEQDVLFVKETLLKQKKPKYDKNKFPISLLGQYVFRKENILDTSILNVDYTNFSLVELEKYLVDIHNTYKNTTNNNFSQQLSTKYSAITTAISLKKKPTFKKVEKKVSPNEEPF